MNWGRRLKRAFTENWREKIISLVLAFLFWFMIKAQDVRPPPYVMPQPQPAPMLPQSLPAPSQLTPVLPATEVSVPSRLAPVVPAPVLPPSAAESGVGAAAGATGL